MNGQPRLLEDDDGFATLLLYHRAIANEVTNRNLNTNDPLPQPIDSLLDALMRLEKTYDEATFFPNYDTIAQRIARVRRSFVRAERIRDLADSGLESLINDLLSNHQHNTSNGVEVFRDNANNLLARGSAQSLTDNINARCRDTVSLNWRQAHLEYRTGTQFECIAVGRRKEDAVCYDQRSQNACLGRTEKCAWIVKARTTNPQTPSMRSGRSATSN